MNPHVSHRAASTRALLQAAVAGLLVAVISALMAIAPAQAAETGDPVTLSTRDVSGYAVRCFQQTVVVTPRYDASTDATWSGHWSALAQIEDAGGELHNAEYDGYDASKSLVFKLCNEYVVAGTYRVIVSWNQYDADGNSIAAGDTFGSFTYTLKPRAASRLSVTKKPYGRTGWTFGGYLLRAGKPYARERVEIWIRWRGSWRNFEETKRTNDRGRASWHTKSRLGKNSYLFQLRYPGSTSTKPARSSTFRLQGR